MALTHLPHPDLPTFASAGALLKARGIAAYLRRVRTGLTRAFGETGWPRVTLYVLTEPDWHQRLPFPYGYPAARVRGELAVYAPRDVPERLRFRVLGALAEAGVAPPGPVEELVDLASGHEYAHALAVGRGLRAAARWADELLANGLWTTGLAEADPVALARVTAWARALAALPLAHPRPVRFSENLALAGRALLACLEAAPPCRQALARALSERLSPAALRAILEPWRRYTRPESSPATRSRA